MQQPVAAAMIQGTSVDGISGNQIRKRTFCPFSCWLSMANETGGGWKTDYPWKLRKPVDCIVHHYRRTRPRCLLNCKEMVLLYFKSSCYIWISCQAAGHTVFAIFVPLGCIHRRQMRESPMSLPRFSGEDFFNLSLVMPPQYLQLNPIPQSCLPTRLSVEPLALRLVRFQEALEEDNCRLFCPNSHRTPW
jgi:hypothetical protein